MKDGWGYYYLSLTDYGNVMLINLIDGKAKPSYLWDWSTWYVSVVVSNKPNEFFFPWEILSETIIHEKQWSTQNYVKVAIHFNATHILVYWYIEDLFCSN